VAGSIVVRELLTVLGVDADTKAVKGFDKAVDGASRSMQKSATAATKLAGSIKTAIGAYLGFATVRAAKRSLDEYAASADKAAKASQQLGISAEDYQALGHAAELSGATMDDLTTGMRNLARTAADAAGGAKASKEAYSKLGISVRDANGNVKPQVDLLKEVAARFATMEDGTAKTAIGMKLFGRSAGNLIPLLNAGAEGINGMTAEAHALGLVVSNEAAAAAEKYNDAQLRLSMAFRGFRNIVAAEVLPILTKYIQGFVDWFIKVKAADRMAKAFSETTRKLGAALDFLRKHSEETKIAIAALLGAMVVSQVQSFGLSILGLAKTFRALGTSLILPALKFAAIAAAIALVILVIEDLIVFARGGDSAIGRLLERFGVAPAMIEEIRATISNFFSVVMSLGQQLMGALQGRVQELIPTILGAVETILPIVMGAIEKLLPIVVQLFEIWMDMQENWLALSMQLLETLLPFAVKLFGLIGGLLVEILPPVLEVVGILVAMFLEFWPMISEILFLILGLVVEVIDAIMPIVLILITVLITEIEVILKVTAFVLKIILAIAIPVIKVIIFQIKIAVKIATAIIEGLLILWELFTGAMVAIWERIKDPILAVWEAIKGVVMGIVQFLLDVLNGIMETVESVINGLIKAYNSFAGTLGLDTLETFAFATIEFAAPEEVAPQTTEVDKVEVNVVGTTDMGPDDLSRATRDGVNQGLREADRLAG
jgi:phage-related protein